MITQQAGRWKFAFPITQDHKHFAALQAAAKFLREHAKAFPAGFVPHNPTQQVMIAIKVYEVFLQSTSENSKPVALTHEVVESIIAAYERFETGEDA